MKINTRILDLPTFRTRPAGQTQPLNEILCSTVQDFLAIVHISMHCTIEWQLGDKYPFLHYSNGIRWQRKPMTAELPFTLLQAGLIKACQAGQLNKWEPVR